MDSAQDPYKKIAIYTFIFFLFFIPLYLFAISLTRPNAIENLKLKFQTTFSEKPKITALKKEEVQAQSSHSTLYFVEFEYDPSTKKAIRTLSGGFKGDLEQLLPSPSNSSDKFSYKIETISSSGELLISGWASRSKFVITTEDGKYRFRATVPYISGETLMITSTENKVLWSGKII